MRDQLGDAVVGERRQVPDHEAPRLADARAPGLVHRELERVEDPPDMGEEHRARGRQLDAPPRAIEEREPELGLQILDLPAQRRLERCRAAAPRGEVLLLGDVTVKYRRWRRSIP